MTIYMVKNVYIGMVGSEGRPISLTSKRKQSAEPFFFRLQYSRQHHHSTNTDFERFHHGADLNDLSIVTMPTTLQIQVGQEEAR